MTPQVYSAPSGKFKAHVDTPRGLAHFGSLVVCLPYRHEGGQLMLASPGPNGQEMTYDWSNDDKHVNWAAFYGDCEHEVKEVTSGHRITLTYNLYAQIQWGVFYYRSGPIDKSSFPLHHRIKEALANPEFFAEGGTLGFHCVHAYAHSNDTVTQTLPHALKGNDALVFSAFDAMGCSASLQGVIQNLGNNEYDRDAPNCDLVATGLHGLQLADEGGDEDSRAVEIVPDNWRSDWRNDIHWFGCPGNEELAVVHMAYGNQASLEWHYSSAAILVEIPSFNSEKRQKTINA